MSAQAIAGRYIKRAVAEAFPGAPLYHVSIQPCFDKKLEAARSDFATGGATEEDRDVATRDTDCVLSSQELFEWMREVDPSMPWRAPLDSSLERLRDAAGVPCEATTLEGSGGYHQHVMRHAALSLFARDVPLESLVYEHRRNANHRVVRLPFPEAESLEFCVAYGFQHIQNIVRGLNKKLPAVTRYQLIELMACPEGCLNGGGQLRTERPRETLKRVDDAFQRYSHEAAQLPAVGALTTGDAECEEKLDRGGSRAMFSSAAFYKWAGGGCGSPEAHAAVATVFHDRKAAMEEQSTQLMHSLKW